MEFFEKYKKRIILAASILFIVVALAAAGQKANSSIVENTLGFVVVPFQRLTTGIGNWISDITHSSNDADTLKEENEALKLQVALLEGENKRLALYEKENEDLSSLLKIAQKYPSRETVAAEIIGKNPGVFYQSFLIDKGEKHGVAPNMVLTNGSGLAGKIVECGTGYAKAQSLLDSRSSVSAMSLRTEDLGVVKGDYSLVDKGLCRMEYIDADANILEGDEIVTSQLSNVYPPGISIGKVKEIKMDSNGLTKYAIIEPTVDFKHLKTVLVINESLEPSQQPSKQSNGKQANGEEANN